MNITRTDETRPAGPAWLLLLVLAALAFPSTGFTSVMTESGAELFARALEAARDGDLEKLDQLEQQLGNRHPLQGYLDFHRLREALPEAKPERVRAYMEQWQDTPLAGAMERLALRRYATNGNREAMLALRDTAPADETLRCHWWRARLEEDREQALAFAREHWASGHSRADACDPLFDRAREAGIIDDEAILERMALAFRAGNPGLMGWLLRGIEDEAVHRSGDWLRRLYRDPGRISSLPEDLPEEHRRLLVAEALHRMADRDTEAAMNRLRDASGPVAVLDESTQQRLANRVAWFAVIRGQEDDREWMDHQVREYGGPSLREQRARLAVREQDWAALPGWIDELPEGKGDSARWQYWLGRALEATGDEAGGHEAMARAAESRSFWGFTAAERLGQAYALNASGAGITSAPDKEGGLLRVAMLRELGEYRLARDEWLMLLRNDRDEGMALAAHARARGWYDLVVEASLQAGAVNHLQWRFPPAWRDEFLDHAAESETDPYLLMAIARRESAFYPEAVSPAGALGLMQIMPDTARRISGWLNESAPERRSLMDRDTSIRLGATYLSSLLERYDGNRLLALAAYNAGKRRVENWMPEDPVPFDVWIESIPFHETRNYVQAVLTYRVLLAAMDRPEEARMVPPLLAMSEWRNGYGEQLLRDEDTRELAAAD